MAEPITPEQLQPQRLTVGETPVYLTSPLEVNGQQVTQMTIRSERSRSKDGLENAILLIKEQSRRRGEEGVAFSKPLVNINDMEEVDWDKVEGLQYTSPDGAIHTIPKDQLSLVKPEEAPSRPLEEVAAPTHEPTPIAPTPQSEPKLARSILEKYTGEPTTLTIVGLKAYETRAHDLAAKSMQSKHEAPKDILRALDNLGENIWKHGIGPVYFQEKARQYYMDMLKAGNSPFADSSIKIAEAAGKNHYQELLDNKNFLTRGSRRLIEWVKSSLGARTLAQQFALEEIAHMRETGEIKEMEAFEREGASIRKRFEMDFNTQDDVIRKTLGEKLDILDPTKPQHKPLVDDIRGLVRRYATGEIATKKDFDKASDELFQTHLKGGRPDIFHEAELYSSSLYEVAESMRAKASHEGGLAAIDAQLEAMQVRLGMGVMGEATALEPTDVKRGTDMVQSILTNLEKKGIIGPFMFNEATVSSGVAVALSLVILPKTAISSIARLPVGFTGFVGGAAVGALFGGVREYRMLEREYLTHLREREAGLTFSPDAKRRAWMERFFVGQRSADDLITAINSDDIQTKLANLADAKARKALSAREHERNAQRVGLIRFSGRENIETQRTALDLTIAQAEKDLLADGKTNEQFLADLTAAQTRILSEGVNRVAGLSDPMRVTLNLLDKYNPEVEIMRRRFPLLGPEGKTGKKAQGLDDILKEFRTAARGEAVKKGLTVGLSGAIIGLGIREGLHLGSEVLSNITQHTPDLSAADINPGQNFQFSENLHMAGANLVDKDGHIVVAGLKDYAASHLDKGELTPEAKQWIIDQAKLTGHTLNIPPVETTPITFSNDHLTTHLGNLPNGEAISAPPQLHWMDTATGRNLVVDGSTNGAPAEQILYSDALKGPGVTDAALLALKHNGLFNVIDAKHLSTVIAPDHGSLPGLPQIVDTHGGMHAIDATFPKGTSLIDTHNVLPSGEHVYGLVDASGKQLLSGIQIDPEGHITNLPALNLSQEAVDHGLKLTNPHGDIFNVVEKGSAGGLFNKPVAEMGTEHGASGPWGWLEDPINADHTVSHALPGTNLAKNLFRGFEENYLSTSNLHDAAGNTLTNQAHYTALHAGEIYHDLPKALFENGQLVKLGHIMDQAIDLKEVQNVNFGHDFSHLTGAEQAILSKMSIDKDHYDLLRSAYDIGRVGRVASKDEIKMFLDAMGGGEKSVTLFTPVITRTLISNIPASITGNDGSVVTNIITLAERAPVGEFNWVPPIPLVRRRPLEAGTPGVPLENILILYGYGGSYSREGLGWVNRSDYKKRRSTILNENPYAKLDEHTEVANYLSRMDPTYRAELETMDNAIGIPMSSETRAVITLPVFGEGKNIRKTLEQFLMQKDKNGNPLDPNAFEIIVFENDTEARPKDETEAEVRKFKADHPEMKVHYYFKRWTKNDIDNQVNTVGNGRRYACDLALLRNNKRTVRPPGDLAVINSDADLEGITSQYIADVNDLFDTNEELDYVIGKRTLPDWALKKPNIRAGQRLWETFDAVMRHTGGGESLEPSERKAGWPGLIGENSAMRASIYAAVGGYGEKARLAEDQNLGDMIRAARNYEDSRFKYINRLETIKNPRRYLTYMVAGAPLIDMYNDYHENKDIRATNNQQLLARIPDTFNLSRFQLDADGIYQKKQDYQNVGDEGFEARFKKTMDLMGAEFIVENGHVKITNTEALMRGLSKPI